jgi:hypothetical protein
MASWLCFGRGSSRVAYLERLCDILNIFDPDKYNEIMSCNAILLKWPLGQVRRTFYKSRPAGGEIRLRRTGGCRIIWPWQTFSARYKKNGRKLIKRRIKLHHRSIEGVVVEWFPYQKGVSVRYE